MEIRHAFAHFLPSSLHQGASSAALQLPSWPVKISLLCTRPKKFNAQREQSRLMLSNTDGHCYAIVPATSDASEIDNNSTFFFLLLMHIPFIR